MGANFSVHTDQIVSVINPRGIVMPGISNNNPVILSELSDDFGRGVTAGLVTVALDPASTITVSRSAAGILLQPPAAPVFVNTWTKATGLVQTVNGVDAAPIVPVVGIISDILGYNAAGALVMQTVTTPKPIIINERYATTTIDYSAVIGFRTPVNPAIDTIDMTTLIDVTATGVTISLPFVSASLAPLIIGVEIDVAAFGTWIGSVTVRSSALINGTSNYTFAKTTTVAQDSPSRCFRWTGTTWRIV